MPESPTGRHRAVPRPAPAVRADRDPAERAAGLRTAWRIRRPAPGAANRLRACLANEAPGRAATDLPLAAGLPAEAVAAAARFPRGVPARPRPSAEAATSAACQP